MPHSHQDIADLRDSQLNVFASLGVYAAVWTILQVLLKLFAVDMPMVQIFDRYGNFSLPGILVTTLLLASAFVPHWILLRRARLSWREAARLIRELKDGVPAEDDPEWASRPARPATTPVGAEASTEEVPSKSEEYWRGRWEEIMGRRADDDFESRD